MTNIQQHSSSNLFLGNPSALPSVYKTAALPTELQGQSARFLRFYRAAVKRLALGLALSTFVRRVSV